MDIKATIDKWSISPNGAETFWITGFFRDHPEHEPTKFCHTSTIEEINFKEKWVKTENSYYKLGSRLPQAFTN